MEVRAKFTLQSMETYGGIQRTVKLNAVYAGKDASEEDKAFWDATPSGRIEISITNPAAADFFEFGKSYYVTFEPASA